MNSVKLATRLDIDERSVISKLERGGYNVLNGSPIPENWVAFVCMEYAKPRANRSGKTNRAAKDILKNISNGEIGKVALSTKQTTTAKWGWPEYLAAAPVPILGLVASYGVFSFAKLFVPLGVALFEGFSFEAIYIALAAIQGLDESQTKRAAKVSIGALIVSAIYGSLAAIFHLDIEIYQALQTWEKVSLSVLHGFPVPILAYFMANLLLHRKN